MPTLIQSIWADVEAAKLPLTPEEELEGCKVLKQVLAEFTLDCYRRRGYHDAYGNMDWTMPDKVDKAREYLKELTDLEEYNDDNLE